MIRVGVGGWTYAPWRDNFYPKGLPQAQELAYASRHLTTIEINGTFYRAQSAASFRKWRDETPDGFRFSVKGHRAVVNQAKLAEAKDAIDWFLASGILELEDKLGPILWQLPPYRRFDAADIAGFLDHLPSRIGERPLLHALEVRHESFAEPAFVELARAAGVAIVFADAKYLTISDVTGPFVYARLQNAEAAEPAGYPPAVLDRWAAQCRAWSNGTPTAQPPALAPQGEPGDRPVFVYMINGAKERAPAAALGLIERLSS